MTNYGKLYRIGFAGYVAGWSVAQVGDTLSATPDGGGIEDSRTIDVDGLAVWCAGREVKLGWGQFPDGAEVIYVYDPNDDGFGYAFAVTIPQNSEWGYAPFERAA